jgi:hypothetical protein
MALDGIWMQEFADLKSLSDPNTGLPLSLFMHAHALFRLAMEAAFTGCLAECPNLFRMTIEAAYQACMILRWPELADMWAKSSRIPGATEEFDRAYNQEKRKKFEQVGLAELHKWWRRYSEWGHVSGSALGGGRIRMDLSPGKIQFQVDYFETDKTVVSLALMDLLQASHTLERAFILRLFPRQINPGSNSRFEA